LSLFLRRTDATSKEQLSPEESEWLASFVQRYFLKVKIPLTAHDLHSEINQFSNRTLQDRLDNDAFWKRNTLRLQSLARVREDMSAVICSEAACERSFQHEELLWSACRNRLSEQMLAESLFVRMNFAKLKLKEQPDARVVGERLENLSEEEWHKMVETLRDAPAAQSRYPRRETVPRLQDLRRGSSIAVYLPTSSQRNAAKQWSADWFRRTTATVLSKSLGTTTLP
jgi:hypothetical protein